MSVYFPPLIFHGCVPSDSDLGSLTVVVAQDAAEMLAALDGAYGATDFLVGLRFETFPLNSIPWWGLVAGRNTRTRGLAICAMHF